jgi:hypothetical protein
MALTPEEQKRLAELQAREKTNKTGRLSNKLEQEKLDLLARQSQKLSDQLKLSKQIAQAEAQHEKTLKSSEKSISSIVGQMVQGNFAAAAQEVMAKKSLASTIQRSAKHKEITKYLKDDNTFSRLSSEEQGKIREIVSGINQGLYTQQDLNQTLSDIGKDRIDDASELSGMLREFAGLGEKEAFQRKKVTELQEKFTAALGRAGIAFGVLLSIGQKFASTVNDIGKSFGVIANRSGELRDNLLSSNIEATKLGGGIGDVNSITSDLSANFGVSLDEASKLSAKVFDTSIALGLSAQEGASLFGVLKETANLSDIQAERLAESTFQLAAQVGVNPSVVMKDIAGSAETIALFTKDGGKNIATAAIQARALGVNLDTSAKIAEGLLDFENSITKEVEASVMIGRQLNLQKARELALNNDVAGAMAEVVKQVGTEEEFNRLNLIQRKALADSIGVSVADLAKFVGKEKEALSLSQAIAQGKSFSDLVGEDAISQITAAFNGFKAIGVELVQTLGPALEFIGGAFGMIAKAINQSAIAMGVLKIAAVSLGVSLAATAVKGVFAAFTSLGPFGLIAGGIAAAAMVAGMAAQSAKAMGIMNDGVIGPGGITTMAGPAGVFELNPRDSVLATTNPISVNDLRSNTTTPAGGSPNLNVVVKNEGITNRAIQQLVDVEYQNPPGSGLG